MDDVGLRVIEVNWVGLRRLSNWLRDCHFLDLAEVARAARADDDSFGVRLRTKVVD